MLKGKRKEGDLAFMMKTDEGNDQNEAVKDNNRTGAIGKSAEGLRKEKHTGEE